MQFKKTQKKNWLKKFIEDLGINEAILQELLGGAGVKRNMSLDAFLKIIYNATNVRKENSKLYVEFFGGMNVILDIREIVTNRSVNLDLIPTLYDLVKKRNPPNKQKEMKNGSGENLQEDIKMQLL